MNPEIKTSSKLAPNIYCALMILLGLGIGVIIKSEDSSIVSTASAVLPNPVAYPYPYRPMPQQIWQLVGRGDVAPPDNVTNLGYVLERQGVKDHVNFTNICQMPLRPGYKYTDLYVRSTNYIFWNIQVPSTGK